MKDVYGWIQDSTTVAIILQFFVVPPASSMFDRVRDAILLSKSGKTSLEESSTELMS